MQISNNFLVLNILRTQCTLRSNIIKSQTVNIHFKNYKTNKQKLDYSLFFIFFLLTIQEFFLHIFDNNTIPIPNIVPFIRPKTYIFIPLIYFYYLK